MTHCNGRGIILRDAPDKQQNIKANNTTGLLNKVSHHLLWLLLGLTIVAIAFAFLMPIITYDKFYNGNISEVFTKSKFKDPDKDRAIKIRKDLRDLQETREHILTPKPIFQAGSPEAELAKLEFEIKQKQNQLLDIEYDIKKIQDLGPISDWIGGLTTPFLTLSTVCLLLLTNLLQRKEMAENDKRTKYNRFENTFFQLLALHHQIVNDIAFSPEVFGRRYFRFAYLKFLDKYRKHIGMLWMSGYLARLDIFEAYKEFYQEHQECLAHYFRNLYNIVRHIHEAELTPEEKMKYIRFLRSQLSTYELLLLFYNAMVGHGFNKFKPLIVKYKLLEHLRQDELASNQFKIFTAGITCMDIYNNDIRLNKLDDETINEIISKSDNEQIM